MKSKPRQFEGVWGRDSEEAEPYPGVWVWDRRVTGSMTDGRSRLPLWAELPQLVYAGFDEMREDYYPANTESYMTAKQLAAFLYDVFEQRGEFARLICTLADVERRAGDLHPVSPGWWQVKKYRRRVLRQLHRCIEALEQADHDGEDWRDELKQWEKLGDGLYGRKFGVTKEDKE